MKKPTWTSHSSFTYRIVCAASTVAVAGALTMTGASAAGASGESPSLAPAPAGAAAGGKVIVLLKHQPTGVNLRTQTRQWIAATDAQQTPVVAAIRSAGGTGVQRLAAPDAVAATVSAAEVSRLRTDQSVAEIIPDSNIKVTQVHTETTRPPELKVVGRTTPLGRVRLSGIGHDDGFKPIAPLATHTIAKTCPSHPVVEPEAVQDIHATNGIPGAPGEANSIATGKGVIIANEGMNSIAGNPDLQRADGSSVIINSPTPTANQGNDETYEDAASVGAQGLNVYQYSMSLPFSDVSPNCTFVIRGDAPDASIVDLTQIDTPILSLSTVMAGIDAAVTTTHADVISESFGDTALPSAGANALAAADEAAVAAGVTVIESSGDSGPQGTVIDAADDPAVIAVGGVDNLHILALNDGFERYVSNNMAAQSSGGTAPTGKVVDLVASDWFGGETACAPLIGGCAVNYPVEVAAGTSEAAPLTAGAAADIIQAYRQTHDGASPTPQMIKDILTGTATTIDAPADEQGAGLLNVYAAVRAAQQMPGTTFHGPDNAPAIVSTPSQLDVTGDSGTLSHQSVSLYNPGTSRTRVSGDFRVLGPEHQIGPVVTQNVTAPAAGAAVPESGAPASDQISFTVPKGLDRLDTDMIWPDSTNSNTLMYNLFDPSGAFVQQSYDDGTPGRTGRAPNMQHAEVTDPMPGRWTAVPIWGGNDDLAEVAPAAPGTYRGTMSFRVSGQQYQITRSAIRSVTIPARSSVTVPVNVTMPVQSGDHPESLELSGSNGAVLSLPIARRVVVPADGGTFRANIIGTTARQVGQISTFVTDVPAGATNLTVNLHATDDSADNPFTYELVDPTGAVVATTSTPQTANGVASGDATLTTADPVAGQWTIDVVLRLTVSGNEFDQSVAGTVNVS